MEIDTFPLLAEAMKHGAKGLQLAFLTFGLTIVLELWSLDTVRRVLAQKGGGESLYAAAISANLRNHFVFGWTIYTAAALLFCREDGELTTEERIGSVFTLLFVHSLCFYAAHRAFHTYPNLYHHHRFHHRFNTNVPPMAANAGKKKMVHSRSLWNQSCGRIHDLTYVGRSVFSFGRGIYRCIHSTFHCCDATCSAGSRLPSNQCWDCFIHKPADSYTKIVRNFEALVTSMACLDPRSPGASSKTQYKVCCSHFQH